MTDTTGIPAAASGPVTIAIDGPAGSGKSSVSKQVARRLGYGYLDTGAAYRALAWHVLAREASTAETAGIAGTADEQAVLAAAEDFPYAISLDPDDHWVRVGDVDVTDAIREPRVTAAVSGVARVPAVRARVTAMFRSLVAASGRPGVVVEGRDITTVVAPDAPVRILLTAAPEVRAARRAGELEGHDSAAVAAALHRRDAADSKVVDFLTAAEGVTVVDSTELDFAQTVDAVLDVAGRTTGDTAGAARSAGTQESTHDR
ncbi:MAG: (d)CMP kinase [Microbacterium sp.]